MEKAKEAYRKERLILKQREEKSMAEQANTELTGFVSLHLLSVCLFSRNDLDAFNLIALNKKKTDKNCHQKSICLT